MAHVNLGAATMLPMQVMLLAAGKGTRLGALGVALPKPLVPVCGYAPLVYNLALCRAAGLTDVVVNLHHHGEAIRAALGDGSAFGVRVRYSDERDLLGTGGGLAQARALWGRGPVLVVNGKVVADLDLAGIVAAHRRAPAGTVATMVVRTDPRPERFAPVEVDAAGRVVALRGVRGAVSAEGAVSPFMFTGVHVLEPALLDRLPPAGTVSDVIADAYLPALAAGERVQALRFDGYFEEHSTPDRYLAGNVALLRTPETLRVAPGPLVGVEPGARVHPTARLVMPVRVAAGASIEADAVVGPDVVVGAGATVEKGAVLKRAVVWEDSVATGAARYAVITRDGVVRVGA